MDLTFSTLPLRRVLAAATMLAVAAAADARQALNPRTYVSPSGAFRLFVDPTAMSGAGPGLYRMSHGDRVVWSGEKPLTLREAVVTDDGVVAGYAYEGGVGEGRHGRRYKGLTVVIFDARGELRLLDSASTHESGRVARDMSMSDSPRVTSIIVDAAHNLFLVSVPGRRMGASVWWTYRLSSGEKTGDIVPEGPVAGNMRAVHEIVTRLVPGTPLSLVQWYVYDAGRRSAAVGVLDPRGRSVWRLDLPGEYDGLDRRFGPWQLQSGQVQVEVREGGFSFRSHSLASRVTYAVEADAHAASGWRVVETQRAAWAPEVRPELAAPKIESVELTLLGSILLKVPSIESAIGGIVDFSIDPAGNIGFVRWGGPTGESIRLVRVRPDGTILTDVLVDLPDKLTGRISAAPVTAERWVLLRHSFAEGVGTRAWWLEVETGTVQPIEGFSSGAIPERLCPTGDGGFLVLAKHHLEFTIQDELARYDPDGSRLWSRREPGFGRSLILQDAAWLAGGGVAAITAVSKTIEYFDANGAHQRSVDLSDLLGQRPNYPAGLHVDANGGLILHDFGGTPPVYRIDAKGQVVAKFQPRFRDGRPFRLRGGVKAAPDGALWTSDAHALLRLDADGVVEHVLGPRPDEDALSTIRAMTVDLAGRIYAVDKRTSTVYVFAPDGSLLRTCRRSPQDFSRYTVVGSNSITVSGNGDVYYSAASPDRKAGYLRLTAGCERVGFETLDLKSVMQTWHFKPGTDERWVLGYSKFHLVDAGGRVIRTIERRPDGDWLERVEEGAVAPDGSIAVISRAGGLRPRGHAVLSVYGPAGEPLRSVPLPGSMFHAMAFNGTTAAVSTIVSILLVDCGDPGGGRVRRVVRPDGAESCGAWYPYFSPDGRELWVRCGDDRELLRYGLP